MKSCLKCGFISGNDRMLCWELHLPVTNQWAQVLQWGDMGAPVKTGRTLRRSLVRRCQVTHLMRHHLSQGEWKLRPQFSPASAPHCHFFSTPLNFYSEQGGLKTGVTNVKFAIGPQTTVISHNTGSESSHPSSSCVPTFDDAFKFMLHRNSRRVTSCHFTKLCLNICLV